MTLSLVTPAAAAPITLADARQHCRASSSDDTVLALYLAAAVQAVQDATGRALITETWRLDLSGAPCGDVILPRAPLLAVSDIKIWSDATVPVDTTVAASVYQVQAPAGPTAQPGRVGLAPSQSWPSMQAGRADALRITFTAGYGLTGDAVPPSLCAAVLLLTGSMYEFREADAARALTENPAVDRLLSPYRVVWI